MNDWVVEKDGGNTGTVCVDDGIDYHEVEFWRSQFDIHQTIPNLPAGVYGITVQGFSRHEDHQEDPDANITIELYAGDDTAKFFNVIDETQRRPVALGRLWEWMDKDGNYVDDSDGKNPQNIHKNHDREFTIDGEVYYAPNGMGAASAYFSTENPTTGEPYYTNHIKVTLSEQKDFVIGVRSKDKTQWTLFDNFRIVYLGNGGELWAEMAEKKFGELKDVYEKEENQNYITLKAKADYEAISKVDYSGVNSVEAYNAYKEPVDALIAYIQEGTKLGNTLHDLLSEYGEKVNVVMFDTSDFLDGHYSEYSTNLENGTCPDNDYLRNAPDVLATEWTQCAVKQANTALFNNLGDIIINPQYTTVGGAYTLDGWNMEKEEGVEFGNYLANEGVAEVYSPSGEYKHYQTIKGLSAGYYRVTVDAYFRPGDMKQADGREACVAIPSRAFLFAEGDEMFVTPIKNILVGHGSQEGVGDETTWTWADESVEYTPNNVAAAAQYFNGVINYDAEETDLSGEADNQSVYRNALNAHVGEDGVLTIGITNYDIAETVSADWCCFSNWTLSLLGAAPDAIKGVSTKGATAPTAIFTIDGRQASRLQRGMNIVRQADGSVKKVLVK